MAQTYEGMFLLDNQVVREDWKKAKSVVTDALKKHGAKVVCARRWDERRLAYPIRRRRRATYCLAYYEMGSEGISALRRDLDLSENVLRYLMLALDTVPANEIQLATAEDAAGFVAPAPPPDDAPDTAPFGRRREEEGTEPEPAEGAAEAESAREEAPASGTGA